MKRTNAEIARELDRINDGLELHYIEIRKIIKELREE
jgi:hypothetical protein